jgi:YidC/Oxa1 family membrane protein insertase
MKAFFTTILFQPMLNVLVWLYNVVPGHDIGLAIIALTILIRLALWPFQQAALKSQLALQSLQPKLKDLQVQYKDDKVALNKAMMELYTKEKVSPFSSCLPLLIQLPFLIALYQVLQAGLKSESLSLLYGFVGNPGTINHVAFGFLDLAAVSIPLAVLAGVAQFLQTRMMPTAKPAANAGSGSADEAKLAQVNKMMLYMMPVMTVVIGVSLPGGLTLYWLVTTLMAIFQQWLFLRGAKTPQTEISK